MTEDNIRSASATGAAATTEKMVARAAMLKNFMMDVSERSIELEYKDDLGEPASLSMRRLIGTVRQLLRNCTLCIVGDGAFRRSGDF
jgi:hypothetical protein